MLTPASVQVVLRGPAQLLRGMAPEAVHAYVDAAQLSGTARLPVAVEFAPGNTGVEVARLLPDTVVARR